MIWKRGVRDRENFTQLSSKDTHSGLETLIKIAQRQSLEIANLLSQRSINCNSKNLSYVLEEDWKMLMYILTRNTK